MKTGKVAIAGYCHGQGYLVDLYVDETIANTTQGPPQGT